MDYENVDPATQAAILRGLLSNLEVRHMQLETEKTLLQATQPGQASDQRAAEITQLQADIEAQVTKARTELAALQPAPAPAASGGKPTGS